MQYRIPDDWLFLNSIAEYEGLRDRRLEERLANPPLDARAVLYGRRCWSSFRGNAWRSTTAPRVQLRPGVADLGFHGTSGWGPTLLG